MKTIKQIIATVLTGFFAIAAVASPLNCEPFTDADRPAAVALRQVQIKQQADETVCFMVSDADKTEIRLFSAGSGEPLFVELSTAGRVRFPKSPLCSAGMIGYTEAYVSDLNQDGQPDYVISVSTGGSGLNADCSYVAFLLSAEAGFTLTTTTGYNVSPGDFILSGGPRFIHATLDQVEQCADGKQHSFWTYNLLAFEKGIVKIDNSKTPGFPKIIWYSDAPNHRETTLLTAKQKAELIAQSQSCWRETLD